jgi:N utilization substance protein A
MTPEQLEEIPGIGEKTLERISVAVRHYFGHFEEGEEAPVAETAEGETLDREHAEADAAASEATVSIESAVEKSGEAEIEDSPAVEAEADAEAENAADVLEEAESTEAAEAEDEGVTAEELAVEDTPDAIEEAELDLNETEREDGAKEGGA